MVLADLAMRASTSRRSSGTATRPTLGSIVQNGKFAACAAAVEVSALNRVDLPTLGKPTIPQLKPILRLGLRFLAGLLGLLRRRVHQKRDLGHEFVLVAGDEQRR